MAGHTRQSASPYKLSIGITCYRFQP